jgi:hypothetical protein
MSEFKRVSAVEWLIEQINEDLIHKSMGQVYEQAKAMEESECNRRIANELKLVGSYFDVSKLDWKEQSHHIRFTSILRDRYLHYKERK